MDTLLSLTFRKGLIPAMNDEILGRRVSKRKTRVNKVSKGVSRMAMTRRVIKRS